MQVTHMVCLHGAMHCAPCGHAAAVRSRWHGIAVRAGSMCSALDVMRCLVDEHMPNLCNCIRYNSVGKCGGK